MQTIPLNTDGAATAAGTINITLNKQRTADTVGSVAWLKRQTIEAKLLEVSTHLGPFRAASLIIGGEVMIFVAENYRPHEQGDWMPCIGIHHMPICGEDPNGSRLTYGTSFTPGARKIIENIADKLREEFVLWIEADGESETAEINIVTA